MFAFLEDGHVVGCGLEKHDELESVIVEKETYLDLFNIADHHKYFLLNEILVKRNFLRTTGNTIRLERKVALSDVVLKVNKGSATLVLSEKAKCLLKESDNIAIFYIEKIKGYVNAKNKIEEFKYLENYNFELPGNVNVFLTNPFNELTYSIEYKNGTS